jgi:hypothetical protein
METWRLLLGNDAYQASSYGQIRSIGMNARQKVLRPGLGNGGYLRVRLSPNVQKHLAVHRLVWEAFRGAIPTGREINHRNGIKADNRLVNLEIVSHAGNMWHAVHSGLIDPKGGTQTILFGEDNPSAKLNRELVVLIRDLSSGGLSAAAIARQLGLKYRTVHHVVAGTYWSKVR